MNHACKYENFYALILSRGTNIFERSQCRSNLVLHYDEKVKCSVKKGQKKKKETRKREKEKKITVRRQSYVYDKLFINTQLQGILKFTMKESSRNTEFTDIT